MKQQQESQTAVGKCNQVRPFWKAIWQKLVRECLLIYSFNLGFYIHKKYIETSILATLCNRFDK